MKLAIHLPPGGQSQDTVWSTDQAVFDYLNKRFGPFVLDACASPSNAKCPHFFDEAANGLAQPWLSSVWMNPPYGKTIGQWMRRAYEEGTRGTVVCCLVPARTDTAWWHDYAMKGAVYLVRGRLKFGGSKSPAPFPSAVVLFGPYRDAGEP